MTVNAMNDKLIQTFAKTFGLPYKQELQELPPLEGGRHLHLGALDGFYSGLTLNQYGVASPCRTICTVCGFVALS